MPLFDSPFMMSRKDMFRLQGGSDPRRGSKTRFIAEACAQLMLAHFRAGDSEFSVSLFGNGSDRSFFQHLERELAERGMPEECELIRYGLYGMQCRLQKRATDKQLLRYTKNRCDLMIKKFWRHMESAAVVAYALTRYSGSVIHVKNISAKYLFIYHAHVLCMVRLQFIDRSWVRARVTRHASMKFWLDIGPRSALAFKTYVNIDALQGSDGINYVWDQHRMSFVQHRPTGFIYTSELKWLQLYKRMCGAKIDPRGENRTAGRKSTRIPHSRRFDLPWALLQVPTPTNPWI